MNNLSNMYAPADSISWSCCKFPEWQFNNQTYVADIDQKWSTKYKELGELSLLQKYKDNAIVIKTIYYT